MRKLFGGKSGSGIEATNDKLSPWGIAGFLCLWGFAGLLGLIAIEVIEINSNQNPMYAVDLECIRIPSIDQRIQYYKNKHGKFPTSLSDTIENEKYVLSYNYLELHELKDIWDREYRYEMIAEDRFIVISAGEDGKFGSFDDVVLDSQGTNGFTWWAGRFLCN